MSPIVPASVSLRASITSTSPGCSDSIAARCTLSRGRTSRSGPRGSARTATCGPVPTIRCPGLIGASPDRNVVRTPRFWSTPPTLPSPPLESRGACRGRFRSPERRSFARAFLPAGRSLIGAGCGRIIRGRQRSDRSNACPGRRRQTNRADEGTGLGSILGNRVTRVEDPRFLTGGGDYIDAIRLPGRGVVRVRALAVRARHDRVDRRWRRGIGARRAGVFTAADLAPPEPDATQPPGPAAGDEPAVPRRRSCALRRRAGRRRGGRDAGDRGRRRRARARRLRTAAGRDRRRAIGRPTKCCSSPTPARTPC